MEMDIAKVIHDYSRVDFNKEKSVVYVPTKMFDAKGITLHDLMLGFSLLSKHGVSNHEQCKGQMERTSGENEWHFNEISEADIENWRKNDEEMLDSIENAWRITIDPKKIAAFVNKQKSVVSTQTPIDKLVLYYKDEGIVFKDTKEKSYSMARNGAPFKVFKYLIDNPNADYELSTQDMASELDMTSARLRNEFGKLNKATADELDLKGSLKLIEAKQGSGYRLNPRIEIIKIG